MTEQDFELVAVTRDLIRNPDTRFLAKAIQTIATGSVEEVAPIYIMLAHKIINKPGAMENLKQALEIVEK